MTNTKKTRPILLLEINEVPWRLIDRFKGHPELPNFNKFFEAAQTYTTTTVDKGELSPWITWPSFHRGLGNREHGIQFLGQDPATFKGKAIWEEYRNQGYSIGICGSLQSWPPVNPGPGGFYIPDTFAHDEQCIPKHVEPFQKFNLGQVRKNGRVIDAKSIFTDEVVPLVRSLPRLGIKPRTLARVAGQLALERVDRVKISRRPIFQSILSWDVFKSLFDAKNPPAFSTFFTNHIAGVMHRYWDNVFPEDFGDKYTGKPTPYFETMLYALKFLDEMLGDVIKFRAENPDLVVVFAASMGQDTVHRDFEGVELAVGEVATLMKACGLSESEFKPLLAMVPQVAVEIENPTTRLAVKKSLEKARTVTGKALFRVEEANASLSITIINPPRADVDGGRFTLNGHEVSWNDAGVRVIETEPGTAYHIPEGVMAVWGSGIRPDASRRKISARDCKKFLLELGGVAARAKVKSA